MSEDTHTWKPDYGPNKALNYYRCSDCGVYMCKPIYGNVGLKVWSDNTFNSPKVPINLDTIPTCSMYKSMKMEEALK